MKCDYCEEIEVSEEQGLCDECTEVATAVVVSLITPMELFNLEEK